MTPLAGQPIVTAAEMRGAEDAAIAQGATVQGLMARAGQEIAIAVGRLAGASPILILCGPGNNGGDGYVAARLLREGGRDVRVAALGAPQSAAARAARAAWPGPVEAFAKAVPAPVLVDALFGTGLTRSLDSPPARGSPTEAGAQWGNGGAQSPDQSNWGPAYAGEPLGEGGSVVEKLVALVHAAQLSIAVDLPSGVATDDGTVLGDAPVFDLTLALGAAKPAHLLQPGARHCGTVRILDIGVAISSGAAVLARPALPAPGPEAHKYTRGMAVVVGGAMPGAARLASIATLHAGAGYVLLLADMHGPPDAVVQKPFSDHALQDSRIGALLIGPGLGRDDDAAARLDAALATAHRLVIDGDALHLLDERRLALLASRAAPAILTPHQGEFDALFGKAPGSKIERARAAAARAHAIVVFKGADTVIATPDGRVAMAEQASAWLSTAGTGDVLAGAIAAMAAGGLAPFDAASAGVWLHGEAARRLGAAFIADDLAHALTAARAAA